MSMELAALLPAWRERIRRSDAWVARWLLLLIVLFGVFYYGSYYNHGLNLAGEGGTTAVLAQRLLEGQRPISDTFLGYNVGWFAPVTAIFAVTGPNFTAMRIFFFALCVLSALLGAFMIWRISRSGWLALAVGLILLLIPGMQFRNYMGFLGVFNQLVLLWAFLWPVSRGRQRIGRLALAGAALGLTYLIRIEVGLLLTPVYLGMLVIYPLWWGELRHRLPVTFLGALAGLGLWGAVHAPVAWDAQRRDYDENFWFQYESFPRYLLHLWQEKKKSLLGADPGWSIQFPTAAASVPPAPPWHQVANENTGFVLVENPPPSSGSVVATWRQRPPVWEMFTGRGQRERYFAAAVYIPVLIAVVWLVGGVMAFMLAYTRRDETLRTDALTVLILTAGALALFPQYFFFRPDTPHLTEFMIPFIPAVAGTMALLVRRWWRRPTLFTGTLGTLGFIAFAVTIWLHFGHAWKRGSSGSIALRVPDAEEFRGLNGVTARVSPQTAQGLRDLLKVITHYAGPDDLIATMPYAPTINFLTARRSYLWNLYMDDANRGEWFEQDQIARILRHRPPVLVIDNRDVNKTEASRFRNWAPGLYAFIRQHYRLEGVYLGQEVYVLEGGPNPLPAPEEKAPVPQA